jgi:4-hydroxy-2-oxoheptanedioate aldolase
MTRSTTMKLLVAGLVIGVAQSALAQSGICPLTNSPPQPPTEPCNLQRIQPGFNAPDTRTINPETWAYGPNTDLTEAQRTGPYWNPVKARVVAGLPFTGRRVSTAGVGAGSEHCNVAGYNIDSNHFTWIDMIHSGLVFSEVWPMWVDGACPGLNLTTRTARAIQLPLDEREAQHAADGGAVIYIFPMDSVEDAQEAAFWTYDPPVGHHSRGGSQLGAAYPNNVLSPDGPGQTTLAAAGGQRNSFNRNAVVIAQIRSVEGALQAFRIAAVEGIQAIYLDEDDLESRAGHFDGILAHFVRAAARHYGKHLCAVDRTTAPHTMTCAKQ